MFKKILCLKIAFFVFLSSFIPLNYLLAEDFGLKASGDVAGFAIKGEKSNIYGLISRVIGIGLSFLGVLFVILILYAGIRWMTARGNQEYVDKAKGIIEAAFLGLIVVLLSYAVSTFVFGKLVG